MLANTHAPANAGSHDTGKQNADCERKLGSKTSIQAIETRGRPAQFFPQLRPRIGGPRNRRCSMKFSKVLLAVGLLAVSTPAFAQTALEQVQQAGVLKIGTEGTYAPFTFHDASGALVGFDVEIGQAIAEHL